MVRHEQNAPLVTNYLVKLLKTLGIIGSWSGLSPEKPVKMDRGKILILPKGTPVMVDSSSFRIEETIKPATLSPAAGKDKKTSGNNS
jgi:hypothetical protein